MSKKELFYLPQMFAEAESAETSQATTTTATTETEKKDANNANVKTDKNGAEPEGNATEQKEPDKKYTDADLDRIINEKFAKWQKKHEEDVSEAKKLAEMNAQQKAEYERDKLQKELDELKKANTLAEMGKTARKMLSDDGVTIPDELVNMLVTTDAETTASNVKSFSEVFKKAVSAAVTDSLKGGAPKTGGAKTLTKDEIMKVTNRAERQKLINENMELFKH